ncbi:MAG TPA: hypothetical protein VK088_08495 [Acidimicrobiia bacterium]|nr:hypothetical protein [Acidimicrobiia bacterium]
MLTTRSSDTEAQIRTNEERLGAAVESAEPELRAAMAKVSQLLTGLATGVAAHSRADASIGLLKDVSRDAPRLSADTRKLELDHRQLPLLTSELRQRANRLEADIEDLITRLREHEQLAQRVVYEAYVTDLGGEG